ncbi:MAG: methyltransferase family protein [Candidatus Eiseniibacteriota bacterium]
MTLLRVFLFVGLLVRRLNLEAMKRAQARPETRAPQVTLVKVIKGGVQLFLAAQALFLDVWPIADAPVSLRAGGVVLFALGLATTIASRRRLGRNWVDLEEAQILREHELVTDGLYRYIRHPIYTADLLLFAGMQVALASWLVVAVLPLVVILVRQSTREEEQLVQAFPGYVEYRLRTKRFIPFVI